MPSVSVIIRSYILIVTYKNCAAYITASNCTEAVLSPIVADIKVVISDAVVKVNALVGQPIDVVLGANVDVHVFASIVADLILVSLSCMAHAYNILKLSFSMSSLPFVLLSTSAPPSTSRSALLSSLIFGKLPFVDLS